MAIPQHAVDELGELARDGEDGDRRAFEAGNAAVFSAERGAAPLHRDGREAEDGGDTVGAISIDIKKPMHLCVNADKNGEGIPDLTQNLLCYKVVISPGTAPAQLPSTVFTMDQLGSDAYRVYGPRDFCVPSTVQLP